MTQPKNKSKHAVVHGRLFPLEDAHNRLNALVHGALKAAAHDHPELGLSPNALLSLTKRVTKQIEGHNYGLEILMSIAKGRVQKQADEGAVIAQDRDFNELFLETGKSVIGLAIDGPICPFCNFAEHFPKMLHDSDCDLVVLDKMSPEDMKTLQDVLWPDEKEDESANLGP